MIEMIWSEDLNGAIGYKGRLLHPCREDLLHFKYTTMGACVLMGRKTYDSLPIIPGHPTPLKGRYKFILTSNRHTESQHNDVEYITNIEDFLKEHNYFKDKRLVVIGGEQVYNLMMPFAEVLHLTGVRKISTHFDAKAPCIPDHFRLVSRIPLTDYSDYERHERI